MTCIRWIIINDDGKVHGLGYMLIEIEEALLGELVVIRRDEDKGISSRILGMFSQKNGLLYATGGSAGNDRNPPIDFINGNFQNLHSFFPEKVGEFSITASGHDAMDPIFKDVLDEAPQGNLINLIVRSEGCDKGWDDTFQGLARNPQINPSLRK
jgi:hypothetical protein